MTRVALAARRLRSGAMPLGSEEALERRTEPEDATAGPMPAKAAGSTDAPAAAAQPAAGYARARP